MKSDISDAVVGWWDKVSTKINGGVMDACIHYHLTNKEWLALFPRDWIDMRIVKVNRKLIAHVSHDAKVEIFPCPISFTAQGFSSIA